MPVALDGRARDSAPDVEPPTVQQDQTAVDLRRPSAGSLEEAERGQPAPGARAGDYELAEEIGHGAFGTVYRAVHPIIGKEVAVKVLDRRSAGDKRLEQRFLTEARAVTRVNHPNVVDIFGFGRLECGHTFYVMELLVGETLARRLRRGGAMSPSAALEVLVPLADGLDAAHRVGVLHRDLKPANVFLHREPSGVVTVKLLDFGVAKILGPADSSATGSGMAMGTPAYMAPEQWGSGSASAASDIYSLGVIAYELLTGRRPHRGAGTHEVVKAHLFEEPAAASLVNPALPAAVDRALAAMLAKQPDERPSSAREAVGSLQRALQDDGAAAADVTTPAPTPSLRRGAVACLVVAALVTAVLGWRRLHTGAAASDEPRAAAPRLAEVRSPTLVAADLSPSLPPALPSASAPSRPAGAGVAPEQEQEQVTLTVKGAPAQAIVLLNGVKLGTAAESLRVPRSSQPLTLQLESGRTKPQSYTVIPDRDRVIVAKRPRNVAAGARKTRASSELEF